MPIETATYISDLNAANPAGTDNKSEGDNHLRLLKSTVQATFPGLAGRFRRLQAKSSAYTAVLNDNTSILRVSSTWTLAFTAAATLGNGWEIVVYNDGAGIVTGDPSTTETINGATTLAFPAGSVSYVWCDGTAFYASVQFINTPAGNNIPVAILEDQKPVSTNGGDFNSGAEVVRTLIEISDPKGIVTVTSSQFTLGAGTYLIKWSAPGFGVNGHKTTLYSVTAASTVKDGTAEWAAGAAPPTQTRSVGSHLVTLTASTIYELRHRCSTTRAVDGLGTASTFGTEVYARVEIVKL